MNARVFRCAVSMAILPLSGMLFILMFKHNSEAINLILLLVSLLQLPMIFLCKRALRPFIKPDAELLSRMGIEYVPAAFEPGRYQTDSKVSSILIWLSMFAPLFTWLAVHHPKEVCVTVLNFATYTAPSMNLLAFSVFCFIIGTLSLPFWFEASRAAAIYAEGSERKRYLLMGFAESIKKSSGVKSFLKAEKEER